VADPGEWPTRLAALEAGAPDAVAAWRNLAGGRPIGVRREVRRRTGEGSVARVLAQHEAIADEYGALIAALPEDAFQLPGGESDWNVAQTLGHAFAARDGLVTAASLAAAGASPLTRPAWCRACRARRTRPARSWTVAWR
jgi:hypothetical protein